jgi:hypothetical protein
MVEDKLLHLLRGDKISASLIDTHLELIEPSSYPFKSKTPIMFDHSSENIEILGYVSGQRAIVTPRENGKYFKAKGIGIPVGVSRPILYNGKIYTYYLYDATIGDGQLIWGLSSVDEALEEVRGLKTAGDIGLTPVKPVGLGYFGDVHVIDLKNRYEMFSLLRKTTKHELMKLFKAKGRSVEAACVFVSQPTDVRVDEVLYGFLHPGMHEIMETRNCTAFLRWLGSSSGRNLRLHHDAGLLHGTISKDGCFMTNAHSANHLVDEKKTYITDYHMLMKSKDKRLRRLEAFILASQMNPLPWSKKAASEYFDAPRPMVLDMGVDFGSPVSSYMGGWFKPKNHQEKYTEAFLEGIILGYTKRRVMEIESKLKKDALLKAALCKRELLTLLGLPLMQRGAEEITKRLRAHKFTEQEIKDSVARIESQLG